jgi:hypothetical protein
MEDKMQKLFYYTKYALLNIRGFNILSSQNLHFLLVGSRPGRVWLVTSRLGTGKTITFFYSATACLEHENVVIRTDRISNVACAKVDLQFVMVYCMTGPFEPF